MAYIAFQEIGGAAVARRACQVGPTADPVPSGTDRLSALEWSVVAIARKDGPGSLRRPGRLSTVLRVLFRQRNPMLADPRLEALRRIAVLSWRHGYTVPSREVRAFLAAGFTPGQYEAMVDRIGATRAISGGIRSPQPARAASAPSHP